MALNTHLPGVITLNTFQIKYYRIKLFINIEPVANISSNSQECTKDKVYA